MSDRDGLPCEVADALDGMAEDWLVNDATIPARVELLRGYILSLQAARDQHFMQALSNGRDAQLWRSRLVSEIADRYRNLGEPYEMARALAESEANDMDEAYCLATQQPASGG